MEVSTLRQGVHGLGRVGAQVDGFLAGEVRGRTLLIGGPRGLGKSSLLNELLGSYAQRGGAPVPNPLLRVDLHGPTLFASADDKAFFEDLFKALHLAVVQRVADLLASRKKTALAERFRVAMLSGDADHAHLMKVWDEAGALGDEGSGLFGLRPGRARQEVTAVWLVARAYMSLSGAYAEKMKRADAKVTEASVSVTGPTAEWVAPVATLVGGGLLGVELFPETPLGAAGMALVSLAVGSVVSSVTKKSKASESRAVEFVETLDASALERWLPVVVRQLKEVGLFPVFVVDELRVAPWVAPATEFIDRLDSCRVVVNHGALFCLMADTQTWLTLERFEATLRGAVTDRTFFVAHPHELAPAGLKEEERQVVVLRARGRPIALASAVRGLTVRVPPRMPEAKGLLEAAVQGAIETAFRAARLGSNTEEAMALDMAYSLVTAWKRGASRADVSDAAMVTALRQAGWIAPDGVAPARVTTMRDELVKALVAAEVAHRMGTLLRWTVRPDGTTGGGWFETAEEAEAWLKQVERSAVALTGQPLATVLLRGALGDEIKGDAEAPESTRRFRTAEQLAQRAGALQALLVAVAAMLRVAPEQPGSSAPNQVMRCIHLISDFEAAAHRAFSLPDAQAVAAAALCSAPQAWAPTAEHWTAGVDALVRDWQADPTPPAFKRQMIAPIAAGSWARRTPPGASEPVGVEPHDLIWCLVVPDGGPKALR